MAGSQALAVGGPRAVSLADSAPHTGRTSRPPRRWASPRGRARAPSSATRLSADAGAEPGRLPSGTGGRGGAPRGKAAPNRPPPTPRDSRCPPGRPRRPTHRNWVPSRGSTRGRLQPLGGRPAPTPAVRGWPAIVRGTRLSLSAIRRSRCRYCCIGHAAVCSVRTGRATIERCDGRSCWSV